MIKLDGYEGGDVCVPNIGSREQRKRLIAGVVGLAIAALVGIFLILSGWAWWTRLILFVFFFSGFSGIFQAREKT